MSPQDIEQVKQPKRRSDNDVYSDNFESKLDPRFRSTVKGRQIGWQRYEIIGETNENVSTTRSKAS